MAVADLVAVGGNVQLKKWNLFASVKVVRGLTGRFRVGLVVPDRIPDKSHWGGLRLSGGGEMGALIGAFDWARTPRGPIDQWSPALRMMSGFLLVNRFPLLLWWGPEYTSIYNDAYRPVLGEKHPWSLGQPVSECWKEESTGRC